MGAVREGVEQLPNERKREEDKRRGVLTKLEAGRGGFRCSDGARWPSHLQEVVEHLHANLQDANPDLEVEVLLELLVLMLVHVVFPKKVGHVQDVGVERDLAPLQVHPAMREGVFMALEETAVGTIP